MKQFKVLLYKNKKTTSIMANKRKSTKSKLDSHVFKGLKEDVVFNVTVPNYKGTNMEITPVFKSSSETQTDDEKLNTFLAEQFLNVKKSN